MNRDERKQRENNRCDGKKNEKDNIWLYECK